MKSYVHIMSKKKLICNNHRYRLFSKGCKLYIEDILKKEVKKVIIPVFIVEKLLSYFLITRRLFRLEPRCGCFIDEELVIFSMRGKIYNINLNTNIITVEHSFKKGMNNPLFFTEIKDIEGFENGIIYGEYIGRGINDTVDIYMRVKNKKWKKVYSFPQNTIKHIHNIIPSKKQKCLYILTGDNDLESGIWKMTSGFNKCIKIVGGSQKYRGCFAFEEEEGLVYASDIPTKENFLYYLNYSDLSLNILMPISGPCIYGMKLNSGDYIFSTSVEPNDNTNGIKALFCFKKGFGVKDNKSHLYIGNLKKGFVDIYQEEKDFFPMPLFGLGVFQFPCNKSEDIYITCQALKKLDGCTLKINRS